MKKLISTVINRLGYQVRRRSYGDYLTALTSLLAHRGSLMIFDVGAHRGETAITFADAFPAATIHSFEPFPESFAVLRSKCSDQPRVTAHNLGLAEATETKQFHANVASPTNSLLALDAHAAETWNQPDWRSSSSMRCDFTTLDTFLSEHKIPRVDLLKIDVQGGEYRVLEGARVALQSRRIGFIYMEIILAPLYVGQWSLQQYLAFLDSNGYDLFGFYNLYYDDKGYVSQLDAIFTLRQTIAPVLPG